MYFSSASQRQLFAIAALEEKCRLFTINISAQYLIGGPAETFFQTLSNDDGASHPGMRIFLLIVGALEIAIVSPIPALDRWQAEYRARVRANISDYLPENPQSEAERALLREICALPDSAFERE